MEKVHKILERAVTPKGIHIQIEDWKDVYPGVFKTLNIGCYPIAKQGSRHGFIHKDDVFRCDIEKFVSDEEVYEVFEQLKNGTVEIEDLKIRITDMKYLYYLGVIENEPYI